MAQVKYFKLAQPEAHDPIRVVDGRNGHVTIFGDSLAYGCFLEGCARHRDSGVNISVIDEDGIYIIGDVGQLDAA